jgi:hypothetical protein
MSAFVGFAQGKFHGLLGLDYVRRMPQGGEISQCIFCCEVMQEMHNEVSGQRSTVKGWVVRRYADR